MLLDNGNVGIGTTNPTTNLQLGSFGTADQEFRIESSGNSYFSVLTTNGVQKIYAGGAGTQSNEIAFYTSNSGAEGEAMRIDTSGNVGIGTTSPSRLLDVDGVQGWSAGNVEKAYMNPTSTGTDFNLFGNNGNIRFDSRAGSNSYINTGNVGIGTTSPSANVCYNY